MQAKRNTRGQLARIDAGNPYNQTYQMSAELTKGCLIRKFENTMVE